MQMIIKLTFPLQHIGLRIYLSLRKWHFDLFKQDCYFSLFDFQPVGNFSYVTLQIKPNRKSFAEMSHLLLLRVLLT